MKKLASLILVGVFLLEGSMFYNHYTYTYHLNHAQGKLTELKELLDDNSSNTLLNASIINVFTVKDTFREEKLEHIVNKIINSTEYAIKNTNDIKNTSKLEKAINEIINLQIKEVELIHNVLEKVENKKIRQKIKLAYEKTVNLQEKVKLANEQIQIAIDNGETITEIDISTSKDKKEEDDSIH